MNFMKLDIYEKMQILNYYMELSHTDLLSFLMVKRNIEEELVQHGFDVKNTVYESIRNMIRSNDILLHSGYEDYIAGTTIHRSNDQGIYTFSAFVSGTVNIARKTIILFDDHKITSQTQDDIIRFLVRNLIFYKLYAVSVFRAIQLNHLNHDPKGLELKGSLVQEPTGYEAYYDFMKHPDLTTFDNVMSWFYKVIDFTDSLNTIRLLLKAYIDAVKSDNERYDYQISKEIFNPSSPQNRVARDRSRSVAGVNKNKPIYETSSGVYVNGNIEEKTMDSIINKVLSATRDYIKESENDISCYNFDIPSNYKFALLTEFEDFNTATVLTPKCEKFIIEDGSGDVYLLYMKDGALHGVTVNESKNFTKKIVEFADLDTASEYECYLPEDNE